MSWIVSRRRNSRTAVLIPEDMLLILQRCMGRCKAEKESDCPSDGLAQRLRDRLRLVDVKSINADLEGGVAFLDD